MLHRTIPRMMMAAAVAALVVLPAAATARADGHEPEPVPFAAEFTGNDVAFNFDPVAIEARCDSPFAFSVTTFRGSGHATHLGKVDFVAEHCSLDFGQGSGPYDQGILTLTAANGDVLMATYTDGVTDPTDFPILAFTDEFTFVDGGTGRFVTASGGGTETGLFHFFTDELSVRMEGTIVYDASNRRHR